MIPVCAVIADDLTGACDAGVQFSVLGFPAAVALDPALGGDCGASVVIVSTASRGDAPEAAARKVEKIAETLRLPPETLIFKKIDSTLRGNVAAEIESGLSSFGCAAGVIAPAFPLMGRTQSGGLMSVRGDNRPPVHLPALLAEQGLEDIERLDSGWEGAGGISESVYSHTPVDRLQEDMNRLLCRGVRFLVCDAVSDSDLRAIAAAGLGLQRKILWIGSAGLARALAAELAERDARPVPRRAFPQVRIGTGGPVALAVGSDHPVTLEQLSVLSAGRSVVQTHASAEDLPRALLAMSGDEVLRIRLNPRDVDASLVRTFFERLVSSPLRGLALSGGDTAALVCTALKAGIIRLESEIVSGIPWGRLCGGPADGLCVATKAGGFGAPDAFAAMVDFLSHCPARPQE